MTTTTGSKLQPIPWPDNPAWRGDTTIHDELWSAKLTLVPATPPASNVPWLNPAIDRRLHEIVSAQRLLADIREFIARYMVVSDAQLDVLTIWIIHTYFIDDLQFTPYLHIYSPMPQCGKSTLLEILKLLCWNAEKLGQTTAASLIRIIDAYHCTMLLDESDMAFKRNSEYAAALTAILNNGYMRGNPALLCVGDNHTPKKMDVFSPKAIASIGRLGDTIEGRSIPIELQRHKGGQKFRQTAAVMDEVTKLRDRIGQFFQSHPRLCANNMTFGPDNNWEGRQQDIAEPLLLIADVAGMRWASRIRKALSSLWGVREDQSELKCLLIDIRKIFAEKKVDKMSSADLIEELVGEGDTIWAEYKSGSSITPAQLARLLKPLAIAPRQVRIGNVRVQGYQYDQFEGAFKSYL